MKWHKRGHVFCPSGERPWMASHAAVPCAEPLDSHRVRIYFTCRDGAQRSHCGWVEIDLRRPDVPLRLADQPVLAPGAVGFFDDSGAMLCWITPTKGGDRFYYQGWNLGTNVPFRNSIGLAVRDGDGRLHLHSPGPILDRGPHDPCFVGSPCVLREGAGWRMWYLSCVEWVPQDQGFRHRYHIKHAASDDGVQWQRDGTVCIDFQSEAEYAICRPSVLYEGGVYRMWYCYRGAAYRIGYAVSADGLSWQRRDAEAGIDVSPSGWDAEMIEYPHVFDHGGARYMAYCGNGYGRAGFGLAVLEQD
jgi:hypothetical protein